MLGGCGTGPDQDQAGQPEGSATGQVAAGPAESVLSPSRVAPTTVSAESAAPTAGGSPGALEPPGLPPSPDPVDPFAVPDNPKSAPLQVPDTTGPGTGVDAAQIPPELVPTQAPVPQAGVGLHLPGVGWSPVVVPGGVDGDVAALIERFFPAEQVAAAKRVAACESGGRSVVSAPNTNGSRDWGVFQLNDGGTLQGLLQDLGRAEDELSLALDPAWNVQAAALLFSQRGWQPWVCAARLGLVDGLYSSVPGPAAP